MAYQGVLDDIRICTQRGVPSRVPVFAISQEFDVRVAGVSHDVYGRDADAMVRVHTQAVERFDYDWAFVIPDDYMEIEPLGVTTQVMPKAPRAVIKYPTFDAQTVARLDLPDFQNDGRMPAFLDALRRLRQRFGDTICLTGNVAAPFTSVALLFGIDQALLTMVDDEDLFRKTTEFFVDLQIGWGRAQFAAGAHAIWLGDCVATSSFISAGHYVRLAADPARRVAAALRQAGVLVFYHGGEIALPHLQHMAVLGADVLSIGERTDIVPIKKALGEKTCLMGNIDGIHVLQDKTIADVRRETARIMDACKPGGGYIFNSGEGIAYDTPEANIQAMIQTAREHAVY